MPDERPKRFLVAVGDPGSALDHVGDRFLRAAETYADDVRAAGEFDAAAGDRLEVRRVSAVSALIQALAESAVFELCYFGHGWAHLEGGSGGVLHLGDGQDADATLAVPTFAFKTDRGTILPNTPVPRLPRTIRRDGRVKLYCSRGASGGARSIAAALAQHLQVPCYGYASRNPILFTAEQRLAHGGRRWRRGEVPEPPPAGAECVYAIPREGDLTLDEVLP